MNGAPFYNLFETLEAARAEGPDFFIYLGDTIYSDSSLRSTGPASSLYEYRQAYRENRKVQALRDLMAANSIFALWDDHEVRNGFDGQTVDPASYANGRQAFFEYMPIEDIETIQDPVCAGYRPTTPSKIALGSKEAMIFGFAQLSTTATPIPEGVPIPASSLPIRTATP